MIIDKKGRLFGLVSVIDIFVVGVIILIVLFGLFQIGNARGIGILETPRPATISFFIESLEGFTAEWVSFGHPVSDHATGVALGDVIYIDRTPTVEYHPNSDGIMVPSYFPYHYTVEITTALEGYAFQNGIWVSGHVFLVGETIVIRAGDTNIFMRISNITIE